jgi:hypothetical protein
MVILHASIIRCKVSGIGDQKIGVLGFGQVGLSNNGSGQRLPFD